MTPLREGGSLPAIVEADDDGLYVLKFTGAGQGPKALVAEVIAGEIGRAVGLPIPELVLIDLDAAIGQNEPDEEIQDLLRRSAGLNLGVDFLPGSLGFDVAAARAFDPVQAARVVWFDAFVTNIDRTAKNPNILMWHRQPWLIDHGAALYFQHDWDGSITKSAAPFAQVRDHVLLPVASSIAAADAASRTALADGVLAEAVAMVPEEWLREAGALFNPEALRAAYVSYLQARLDSSAVFVKEADRARMGGV